MKQKVQFTLVLGNGTQDGVTTRTVKIVKEEILLPEKVQDIITVGDYALEKIELTG
jgi:hypothetical protein